MKRYRNTRTGEAAHGRPYEDGRLYLQLDHRPEIVDLEPPDDWVEIDEPRAPERERTELEVAEAFAAEYAGIVRCEGRNRWSWFDGTDWRREDFFVQCQVIHFAGDLGGPSLQSLRGVERLRRLIGGLMS